MEGHGNLYWNIKWTFVPSGTGIALEHGEGMDISVSSYDYETAHTRAACMFSHGTSMGLVPRYAVIHLRADASSPNPFEVYRTWHIDDATALAYFAADADSSWKATRCITTSAFKNETEDRIRSVREMFLEAMKDKASDGH